jgi:hypothetical protein
MILEQMPEFLTHLIDRLCACGVFDGSRPNHVLLNEYTHGQGIAPHCDGPLYEPRVAILSLEGPAVMDFLSGASSDNTRQQEEVIASVFLRPRSLLVFHGDAYTNARHCIAHCETDTVERHCCNGAAAGVVEGESVRRGERRLSLTIRKVKHTVEPIFTAEAEDERQRRAHFWYNSITEKDTTSLY